MATITAPKTVLAFLDLIAEAEGTSWSAVTKNDGYDIIVNGVDQHEVITDYSAHPFATGRAPIFVSPALYYAKVGLVNKMELADQPPRLARAAIYSTAAGRYQIILPTWAYLTLRAGLSDFTPLSQDKAAIMLLAQRDAMTPITTGDVEVAIDRVSAIWASFPGNDYRQPGVTKEWLLSRYYARLKGL